MSCNSDMSFDSTLENLDDNQYGNSRSSNYGFSGIIIFIIVIILIICFCSNKNNC